MKQHITVDQLNELSEKECFKCKEIKKQNEFYKNKINKDGFSGSCKTCVKKYQVERRKLPEVKASQKVAARKWARKDYALNPDRHKEVTRNWSKLNRDKVNLYYRSWKQNNPELLAEIKARRYAREKGAEGSHTAQEWLYLLSKSGNACVICGSKEFVTRDHIVPLSKGGSDYIFNIQPLCKSCNCAKKDKSNWIPVKQILESESVVQ